jgi:hypothetical protein
MSYPVMGPMARRRDVSQGTNAAVTGVIVVCMILVAAVGCAGAAVPTPGGAPPSGADTTRRATSTAPGDPEAELLPAGYGTLRQDAISLRLGRLDALQIRATPLDESVIRLLSPDSYRALAELKRSKAAAIEQVARRNGVRNPSVWYVSFFTVQQGETRFSPRELIITNVGRDFRPLDVIPLTPGFGEQRLRQNERQDALYAFDNQLNVQQPLTVAYETARNNDWVLMLPALERERSLVKSRAGAGRSP